MEKKKTVVVALGHRALGATLPEQKRATKEAAKEPAQFYKEGLMTREEWRQLRMKSEE